MDKGGNPYHSDKSKILDSINVNQHILKDVKNVEWQAITIDLSVIVWIIAAVSIGQCNFFY